MTAIYTCKQVQAAAYADTAVNALEIYIVSCEMNIRDDVEDEGIHMKNCKA